MEHSNLHLLKAETLPVDKVRLLLFKKFKIVSPGFLPCCKVGMNIIHLIFAFQKMKRLYSVRGESRENQPQSIPDSGAYIIWSVSNSRGTHQVTI